jgi:hypothetical protein
MAIIPNTLKVATSARNTWRLVLTDKQTYGELFQPETWLHVSRMMHRGDLIEAQPHDGAWFAKLRVVALDAGGATVGEVFRRDFDPVPPRDPSDFNIIWAGDRKKWQIVRKSDKAILADGLASEAVAKLWIETPLSVAPGR